MDELKEAWQSISLKDVNLSGIEIRKDLHAKSQSVLSKLKRKVRLTVRATSTFTLAFAIITPFVFPVASQVLLLILTMAYLVASILLYQQYQVLQKGIDLHNSLLDSLNSYKKRILTLLKYEELVALCLYPISITAGFLYGRKLFDPGAVLFSKPRDWFMLIALTITLTLIGHLAAKWFNKYSYGKYLARLDDYITELEAGNAE